jgi:hypothetical protein
MMKVLKNSVLVLILLFITCNSGCRKVSVPKPVGYFRIDLPKREYVTFDNKSEKKPDLPFSFEYPAYGKLTFGEENQRNRGG